MRYLMILILASVTAWGATCTATQNGNWTTAATWGGTCAGSGTNSTPATGDIAAIAAKTVTVDANVTVGTSPNDATTAVITSTTTGRLNVAAGVTLIVKGNMSFGNGGTLDLEAGATLTFDNSSSGGSPVYQLINIGSQTYIFNGTAQARATFQAIAGQSFIIGRPWTSFTASYTDFYRGSVISGSLSVPGDISITNCTFTSWGPIAPTNSSATVNVIVRNNVWTSGTGANDFKPSYSSATFTSGTREISGNVFSTLFAYDSTLGFSIFNNYFGNSVNSTSQSTKLWTTFHDNFVNGGSGTPATGQIFVGPTSHNYFVQTTAIGNPHFIAPVAVAAATTYEQNIFESQSIDAIDTGDAILINAGAGTTFSITLQNNIVLPDPLAGANYVASGTMATIFSNSTTTSNWNKNTFNTNKSAATVLRGGIAYEEGGGGFAGQIAQMKSNLAWGSTSGQGALAEQNSGTTLDVILPAGADYNWTWNTDAGNNGRSYNYKTGGTFMWSGSQNAAAAGVDNHQGTGDPRFLDSTRCAAKWAAARGYGSTFADAQTALKANPARVSDLIDYVRQGYIPTSLSLKGKAHDGTDPGAVVITVFGSAGANMSTSLATTFSGGVAF